MTTRQFEIFLALAQTPNMRKVAIKMYLSQAAISSSLHAFEEEIGVQLFDRVNHRLILNEKGKLLRERLSPIYAQIKEVMVLVSNDGLAGNVRVGASTTLADFVIPQIIYDFNKKYKDVNIKCDAGNTADILRLVEDGVYDIGFVEGEVRNLNVVVRPLVQETLLIVTADKAFAQNGEYSLASLMDKNWLLREKGSGTREVFLDKLTPLGLRPQKFMEFNHNRPIKTLLGNAGTLSCLSPHIVERELAAGELFVVKVSDMKFTRTFYRVEHKDKHPSALVDLLAEAIQNHMKPCLRH